MQNLYISDSAINYHGKNTIYCFFVKNVYILNNPKPHIESVFGFPNSDTVKSMGYFYISEARINLNFIFQNHCQCLMLRLWSIMNLFYVKDNWLKICMYIYLLFETVSIQFLSKMPLIWLPPVIMDKLFILSSIDQIRRLESIASGSLGMNVLLFSIVLKGNPIIFV